MYLYICMHMVVSRCRGIDPLSGIPSIYIYIYYICIYKATAVSDRSLAPISKPMPKLSLLLQVRPQPANPYPQLPGALWDCVLRVGGGGGGCAGGGVPLGAVPVLSWCGGVSRGYTIIIITPFPTSEPLVPSPTPNALAPQPHP